MKDKKMMEMRQKSKDMNQFCSLFNDAVDFEQIAR